MKKKQEIIYSDTVNEIISKPPKSIVRWGNMIVFAVFLLLILLSWFFVYPEKTEASAVIVRNDIATSDSLPGEYYMGILTTDIANFGKVTSGQPVNIRLTAYPYQEYGIIRGSVISKTITESGSSVELTVKLTNGLVTNYDRKLEYFRNMQGDADIITGKQRLLQIVIDPLIRLFAKKG